MPKEITISYYKSPFGELILGSIENKLCLCDWRYRKMRTAVDARLHKHFNTQYLEEGSETIENTIRQLEEYAAGKREHFDIELALAGTVFQNQVWNELKNIPFGKTASYLDLSKKLQNEKAIRAVAAANGANAISIIVPCHRIIGSDGSLVGYAGGLAAKKKLLELENKNLAQQMSLF